MPFSIDDFMPPEAPLPVTEEKPGAFTPTEEQAAIITAAKTTKRNMLISALAGAAKTSTLVLLAEQAFPSTAVLCLAFNKRIAVEMQKRLPSTCVAKTLNSLGYTAWAKALNKRFLQVDERKTYKIVKDIIDEWQDPKEKSELYKRMADIMKAVDQGKTAGYVPDGHYPHAHPLMGDEDFFAQLDEQPSDLERDIIVAATLRSMEMAWQGDIDFGDQLFMPTIFRASFVQYPITMVDEAQDLSELNHEMLRLIVGNKRLIAVGDACQSIYGFRGAHESSMELLRESFDMDEFLLSISFRCPIEIVKEAQWRAPHMRYPEWAKPGAVKHLALWDEHDIPDFGVILCRNNAPLFAMAIKLLKRGRYPELVGNDLGKTMLKILRGFGDVAQSQAVVLQKISEWKEEKLKKSRSQKRVMDQADCLTIFAQQGRNLGEAIAYCEHVLSVAGPVKLMTGHKSKGLEFDHVFILDQELIGDDQQDKNLRYVMQTRAKETLSYIRSSAFDDEENAQEN